MTTFDIAPTIVPAAAAWRALGTTVHVLVTDPGRLGVARRAVAGVLADVDATYSRFRTDSELRVLAADAGREAGGSGEWAGVEGGDSYGDWHV